jgi:hypothetical protein
MMPRRVEPRHSTASHRESRIIAAPHRRPAALKASLGSIRSATQKQRLPLLSTRRAPPFLVERLK